ncbi:MAG: phosphate ABC transporter substrate-binding protein PstS [Nostoc sp. S4]|nr:phosphate ABC transporter substrate-binding protein PstS [Nostoc sp. S4]
MSRKTYQLKHTLFVVLFTLSIIITSCTNGLGKSNTSATIIGAGGTFPAPLYQRWFSEYNKQKPNIRVIYQPIGSGAGVEQFTEGTIDFGGSDVAMKDDEIKKVKQGVILLPMTAGSIVIGYKLPNIKNPLKLSRSVIANIFLGKIQKWNDPAIAKTNPGVNLPDSPITVIHRSEGSGTTGIFTKFLSKISPEWKDKVGDGKAVDWPVGVGGKGNEGVAAQIQQLDGAIGYVEYGYAKQTKLKFADLENKAGKYITVTTKSVTKALDTVELPENLRAFIDDPTGEEAYPLVTYTWLLVYKKYEHENKAKTLKEVLSWALTQGQKNSEELGYVPLPEKVLQKVKTAVNQIQT